MKKYDDLKEEVYLANMELASRSLVLYTFGNVSGIDRSTGIVAIKPSGVPYEDLKVTDIVLVDLDNKQVESNGMKPSSDTKTHTFLYNSFGNISGVTHTHSSYATSWAQAKKPIPCLGTTHADYVPGFVPCTDTLDQGQVEGDYEHQTGVQIVEHFKRNNLNYEENEMVLVASHGPFTWGDSAAKSVYNSVVLEELAKISLMTLQVNGEVGPIDDYLMRKHFYRKHGSKAYYGQ